MKISRKLCAWLMAMATVSSQLPVVNVFARGLEEPESVLLYENTFDTGSNADLAEVTNQDFYYPGYNEAFKTAVNNYEYAAPNAPANYKVSMRPLSKVEVDGNTGVRFTPTTGVGNGPVVLFDFRYQDGEKTPSRTPNGLRSGKYTMSFDFSVQGDIANADGTVRVMANCFHGNSASNLVHFDNKSWSILAGSNSWTYSENKDMPLDPAKVYNYKMVLDLDNHEVLHYLDGEFIGKITGYKRVINFITIAMCGDMDYFDNLKLFKEIKYPVEFDITSEKAGNNFFGKEPMKFKVTATNREDTPYTENAVIKVTNPQGGDEVVVLEKQLEIPGNSSVSFDVTPDFKKFGSWVMSVESERSRAVTTRFARIVEVGELNDTLGVCVHLDGRHGSLDVAKTFDLVEAAGLSMIRSDHGYGIETDDAGNITGFSETKGKPEWFSNMIDESIEHGIEVLPILPTGSSYFGYDADGGFNTSDEALATYTDYCEYIAKKYKEYGIEQFELGNEDNYATKPATQNSSKIMAAGKKAILNNDKVYTEPGVWNKAVDPSTVNLTITHVANEKTGATESYATLTSKDGSKVYYENLRCYEPESGAEYAKILKAGYEGIKKGNPDALVINSGSSVVYEDESSTIRNQYEFADQLLGAINADPENGYYDAWGVHSYHGGAAPESGDRWKRNMDFRKQQGVLTGLLEKHNQISKNADGEIEKDVSRWTTEIGYSVAATEERKYASWMTRLLALNFMGDEYGPYHDKFIIYALFNHGFNKAADSENCYGIVNNWEDEYWYKKSAYSVKESYLAVAQWNKMMNGANFVKADINEESGGYVDGDEVFTVGNYNFEFDRNGDKVALLWDVTGGSTEFTVTDDKEGHIRVYDMYGNIIEETHGDSITVTADSEPLYVEFAEPKADVLLYRDYEDYTSGSSIYNSDTKYGTWNVATGGGVSATSVAVDGTDGKGVMINTSADGKNVSGSWGNKVDLANIANSGLFYIAFDIAKKSDEELNAQDGETPLCHENLFYLIDSTDYQSYVRFSTSHSAITSGMSNWNTLASTYLPGGTVRVETVIDLDNDKLYLYENGVEVGKADYTRDIKRLCVSLSNGIGYFDNFSIVHYPLKSLLPTYSMTSCEYNAEDNTISVILKSDLKVPYGDVFYTAPYGISLKDFTPENFTISSSEGRNIVITEVVRGEKAGEYILKLSE